LLVAFSACKRAPKDEAPPPPPEAKQGPVQPKIDRPMPIDPRAPMQLAKPDEARVQIDLASSRAAIREYQQLNDGKNPPDLAALNLRLSFPMDIVYDSASATVKSRTYPMY
jgi:hypothetical protein